MKNFYLEEILIDGKGGSGGAGKRLIFPIIPDEVNVSSGANTIPINIIKTGEARIPRGEKATGYSWDGMLPGKSMKGAAFINSPSDEWQSAITIVKILEKWKKNGTPLKFVCGKYINADVFIENFNRKYFGQGHCKYSITLTKYPALTVSVSAAPKSTKKSASSDAVGRKGKTTKKVAYRSGPGTSYTKLGTLNKGVEVTIYAVSGNWYKIKNSNALNLDSAVMKELNKSATLGSREWWVCATYVKLTSGKPTKTTPTSTSSSSSSSSGKKSKSHKSTRSSGGSGGKKRVKVTVPSTKLVSPQTKVLAHGHERED